MHFAPAGLLRLLPALGCSTHLSYSTIEISILPFFRGISPLFPHFGEMIRTILAHISLTSLLSNSPVVLGPTLLLKNGPSLLSNTSIIVFTILVADRASSFPTRF